MAVTRINKDDMAAINAYMYLSGALVKREAGVWIIDTPEATIIHENTEELLEDIKVNLACMKECVEPEMWEEAWNND